MTYRGLLQHLKFCSKKKQNEFDNVPSELILSLNHTLRTILRTLNGTIDGLTFENLLNDIYGNIVYWRKNLFLLPTGAACKNIYSRISKIIASLG